MGDVVVVVVVDISRATERVALFDDTAGCPLGAVVSMNSTNVRLAALAGGLVLGTMPNNDGGTGG